MREIEYLSISSSNSVQIKAHLWITHEGISEVAWLVQDLDESC